MEAQSRLVLPQKLVNQEFLTTHFTNNLYNSIIDGYKESQHGVRNDLLEHLTSLTRSVTQVLQNLHSRIAPSKLPEQFRFPLERVNNQDRTRLSQSIVENLSARLVKSIGACSSFVCTKLWSAFDDNQIMLLDVLDVNIAMMACASRNAIKNHQKPARSIAGCFSTKQTIIASNTVAACYLPLQEATKSDYYNFILINTKHIGAWQLPNAKDELDATAWKRQQRF